MWPQLRHVCPSGGVAGKRVHFQPCHVVLSRFTSPNVQCRVWPRPSPVCPGPSGLGVDGRGPGGLLPSPFLEPEGQGPDRWRLGAWLGSGLASHWHRLTPTSPCTASLCLKDSRVFR